LERKGTSRVYRGRDKTPRNASRYIIAIGQLYLLRRGGRRQTCLLREGGPHTVRLFSAGEEQMGLRRASRSASKRRTDFRFRTLSLGASSKQYEHVCYNTIDGLNFESISLIEV